MPLLGARDLVVSYGGRDVLAGVSLTIEPGERLGLVGVNGSGKSTLARIIAGLSVPDAGEIVRGREVTLGYLSQEPVMDEGSTALEVALSGLREWAAAMARYDAASAAIAAGGSSLDPHLAEQAAAAAVIDRMNGWEVQYQAEAMLGHLGVARPDQVVGTMSGGERRRVAMARVLVASPDIAVLDEPTNHLDVTTIEWLESYLLDKFSGSLLLITHDRYLLDRVVTRTLELDRGQLYSYDGGWDAYLTARTERAAQAERVEANRQNFLRRELEWLRRQPKARTGKSKARIARAHSALDSDAPRTHGVAAIAVGATRSGKTILEADHLRIAIGDRVLVDDLSLAMRTGERIGVVGPNGAGKTTLVRTLLGERPADGGRAVLGKNTVIAYLDQARGVLRDDASIFENVADDRTMIELGAESMEVRTYLQRFLFPVPEHGRAVGTLSGGERARVALARALSDRANLVVLDEPTNDLDVTTLAALEAALLDAGTSAIVVTHDRWFLDRVATSILGFEGDGRVVHVQGNYADYLAWRERDRAEAAAAEAARARPAAPIATAAAAAPEASGPKKLTWAERRELEGLMERIDTAETQVSAMEDELSSTAFAERDYQEQAAFLERLAAARAEAEALVERWSELEARAHIG